MSLRCQIFPYTAADGPTNMARDEAMLDAVAEDPTLALLRTYGWSEPTLSLGYFQPVALAECDPRWHGRPLVRRATGGGAIWHHHELTYALVVPASHRWARPSTALYHGVHTALARLIQAQGIDVRRRGPLSSRAPAPRPFLCFADRDPEDLVVHAAKIVGSAQRRRSGAILQHGSMLLQCSPLTPEFAGLCDLVDARSDPTFWAGLVAGVLPEALGLVPSFQEFGPGFRRRVLNLEREVYRNLAWNRRR
jgi:lipoate-protein ligase A